MITIVLLLLLIDLAYCTTGRKIVLYLILNPSFSHVILLYSDSEVKNSTSYILLY